MRGVASYFQQHNNSINDFAQDHFLINKKVVGIFHIIIKLSRKEIIK